MAAPGRLVDVGLGHLGIVDSPGYATGLKVAGDGLSMNPELCGEGDERAPRSVGGDELVDLGLVEAALNGTPHRFQGSLRLASIGFACAAGSVIGGRV